MTHPLLSPLLRKAKMDAFHTEADHLMQRIAKLVPGCKLTLVIRTPGVDDGSRDILLTDDTIPEVVRALEMLAKRPEQKP